MSTPLYTLRAKNVATTIATLQGLKRSIGIKDAKAVDKIMAILQDKLQSLKAEKKG